MIGRYRLVARRHGGHVWHVEDLARFTTDVVAFRPDGIGPGRPPYAVAVITDEAATPDALALVERRLARTVGLRLP